MNGLALLGWFLLLYVGGYCSCSWNLLDYSVEVFERVLLFFEI